MRARGLQCALTALTSGETQVLAPDSASLRGPGWEEGRETRPEAGIDYGRSRTLEFIKPRGRRGFYVLKGVNKPIRCHPQQ